MSAVEANRGRVLEAHRSHAVLILARVFVGTALVGMALGAVLAWWMSSIEVRYLAKAWATQEVRDHLNPAMLFRTRPEVEGETVEHLAAMTMAWRMLFAGIAVALPLATGMTILVRRQWIGAARRAARDDVKRGNQLVTPRTLTTLVNRRARSDNPICLGGVPIPAGYEHRHGLLIGSSGSGKTTALHGIVQQATARGEHVMAFDPDQSYVATHYRPERGDIILNRWDERSARWDPLLDVADIEDAYRVAAILLPKPKGVSENAIWFDQARAVVAHVMHRLVREGRGTLDDLADILAKDKVDKLRAFVSGTEAARAFEEGAEKASAGVAFMLTPAARIVRTLAAVPKSAPSFSFDRFYRELPDHQGDKPCIFIAAPRRVREAADPIITACIDAAAAALLQRKAGTEPPAWLVIDEVASLPPAQSLLTLLPEGRKHRASVVLAIQSIAQLRQNFGPDGAEIISGQTATQLVMTVGDHPTAQWAVDLFADIEAEAMRPTETLGDDKHGQGSLSVSRERKNLILRSDVLDLKPGEAYLRFSGYPPAKIAIDPPQAVPDPALGFLPVPPAIGEAVTTPKPETAPTPRIEDRDDWLTAGGL